MHERRKALRAWATEHSKQDGAAVEDKGQRASDTHDQKLEIQFACATCQSAKCAHEYLRCLDGDGVSKESSKSQENSGSR